MKPLQPCGNSPPFVSLDDWNIGGGAAICIRQN